MNNLNQELKLLQILLIKEGDLIINSDKNKMWNELVFSTAIDIETVNLLRIVLSSIKKLSNGTSCQEVYNSLNVNNQITNNQLKMLNLIIGYYTTSNIGYLIYCNNEYKKENEEIKSLKK